MKNTTLKIVLFWIGKNYNQIFIILALAYIVAQLVRCFINLNF